MLHAISVGQGILAIAPLPGTGGDYASEIREFTDWRPALVITLVTEAELAAAGAASLGQDVRDRGTRWRNLPVPDFGAPDDAFKEAWSTVSSEAGAALQGGGRVLVHCKGGCGRSGMVALRLMIEAGEAPDAALTRLRSIRPCAVETDDQMRWARAVQREHLVFMRGV